MTTDYSCLRFATEEHVAQILLDAPPVNCIGEGLLQDLEWLLDTLEQQGFARERKGLSPHITLGREVEPQRNFTDVQRGVRVEPMRVSVRSISLMESVRRGARLMYVPVFRQNLIGK